MNRTLKIFLIVGGVATAAVGAMFAVKKVRVLMDEQAVADDEHSNVTFSRPVPKIIKKPTKRPIPIRIEVSEADDDE